MTSVLAYVARALEMLEDGRHYDDRSVPADVADEVVLLLVAIEEELGSGPSAARRYACPQCSEVFEWPGLRERHLLLDHGLEEAERAA